MGNKIRVPGVTGKIGRTGVSPAAAPTMDIQVQSQGQKAAMGIGFAVVGLMAEAAQAQAETRAMNRLAKWQLDTQEEFRNTKNATEAFDLMNSKKAEFGGAYNDIVNEEGSGLFPLLSGDYKNNMTKRYPGMSINASDNLTKMGQEAFNGHFEVEQAAAIELIRAQQSAQVGPWKDEDPAYQAALNNVAKNASVLGNANARRHMAALSALQKDLKIKALNDDIERIAKQTGSTEQAIDFANDSGIAEQYGLTVNEAETVMSGFKSRVSAEEKAIKAVQAEKLRAWNVELDEKIYQSHDLKWSDLDGHPDKVKRWKEWESQLDRIKSGTVLNTDKELSMSNLYRAWRDKPTEENRQAALTYWRENNTFFSDGERTRYKRELAENDPESPDALTATSRGHKSIYQTTAVRELIYKTGLKDDEMPLARELQKIRNEGLRQHDALDKYVDTLGKQATNADITPFVTEMTKLQNDAVIESWWKYQLRSSIGIITGLVRPEEIGPKITGTKTG